MNPMRPRWQAVAGRLGPRLVARVSDPSSVAWSSDTTYVARVSDPSSVAWDSDRRSEPKEILS